MKKNAQHIVPHNGQWAVKRENSERASSLHATQSEAVTAGKETAKNQHTELVIHGRDGRIREKNSYGKDPFPPKG